ncbi:MAG TPA: hypothetical protein VM848_19555 [Acidimicrobiia bacterium]|nr:hypothetical protein [Acidimicrobiia bacterium]
MRPRRLLVALVALVLCACTPSASTTTAAATTGSTTTSSSGESTTSSETTLTTLPAGTEELPESLRAEIARLILVTEEIRGLEFLSAPQVTVLTPDELETRVVDQLLEDYLDHEVDEALYRLLGLVPADFELLETILSLYGEAVAGYYDGDTGELVVTATQDEFSPLEEATIVHELTHALTDQVLEFNDRYNRLFDDQRYDEAAAFQALIEGDASLAELLYLQQLDAAAQQEFLEAAFDVDMTVFDQVPPFIQDSLVFPYDTGFTFVQHLYSDDGYAAVDDAYADPPLSSEQVIWPDDYPDDVPLEVSLPTNELTGYELNEDSTWGELGFRLMFDQVLGGNDGAAEGWGGDSYRIYWDGTNVVLVIVFQGDTAADAAELGEALNDYVGIGMDLGDPLVEENSQTYTGNRYAFVATSGDEVVFIAASDPASGPTVRGWFPEF